MSPARYRHSPLPQDIAPKLAGGRADSDYCHDSLPESSVFLSHRKGGCDGEGEECFGRGQPPLSAGGNGFRVGAGEGGGGGWHRTHGDDTSCGAFTLPGGVPACYCPPRWRGSPPSGRAKTAESSRRCRRRPHTRPEAGSANISHADRRRPCNECAHRGCAGVDAGEHRRGDSSRGGRHESVAAAVTAAAGATVAAGGAAPDGVGVGEDLRGGKHLDAGGGPLSRAAVEAWEAAETWASVVAAATGAVAAGGSLASAESAESSAREKAAVLGGTATVESDHHRRRNCCTVEAKERAEDGCSSCCRCAFSRGSAGVLDVYQSTLHRRDSVLVCGSGSSTSTTEGLCHSAVHRRDSVLCSSSKVPMDAALNFVGRVPGMGATTMGSSTSTCPPYPPTRSSPGSGERPFDAPGRSKAPSAARPVVVAAAAAIVLGRIDRGEKLWARRARRAGLAALKDHRARAGRQKLRGATAARFYETALKAGGLRALEALVSRRKGRGEDAVAAAAAASVAATIAYAFARQQRMRRVAAMLNRWELNLLVARLFLCIKKGWSNVCFWAR